MKRKKFQFFIESRVCNLFELTFYLLYRNNLITTTNGCLEGTIFRSIILICLSQFQMNGTTGKKKRKSRLYLPFELFSSYWPHIWFDLLVCNFNRVSHWEIKVALRHNNDDNKLNDNRIKDRKGTWDSFNQLTFPFLFIKVILFSRLLFISSYNWDYLLWYRMEIWRKRFSEFIFIIIESISKKYNKEIFFIEIDERKN